MNSTHKRKTVCHFLRIFQCPTYMPVLITTLSTTKSTQPNIRYPYLLLYISNESFLSITLTHCQKPVEQKQTKICQRNLRNMFAT